MTDQLRHRLQVTLGASYTLGRELGGGGMSRVFVAREEALGRSVVVKVLAPELAAGLSVERFAREVRLAARLQHPNVVPVLTAGTGPDGLPYYTMPFIEGSTLRERLAVGPPPLLESIALLRDVARALAYAHTHGVVHRDIKPENVLLTGGAAVVADFGIAKAVHEAGGATTLTQSGVAIGTPAYMAPEQALGDEVDARADLYAWGVVAYEALSGTHPFAGRGTAQQLVAAHVSETPLALHEIAPHVPATIVTIVMQCLGKDPASRPTSAADVLEWLEPPSMTPGLADRVPWSRRAFMPVMLGGALLAVGIGAVWLRSHERVTSPAASGSSVAAASETAAPRVAVLPFENLGEPDDEVFAAGITEEITTRLAEISALRVVSRTSAKRFRGRDLSIAEIGKALNADYVLEGTVRTERAAGRTGAVRVSSQLIRVTDDVRVWQRPLDATLAPGDIFRVQASIASDVASAMNVVLIAGERRRVARIATRDSAAYRLYQLGRFQWEKRTPESLVLAQQHFRAAVARDPSFAAAWAGLGDATFVNLLGTPAAVAKIKTDSAIAMLRQAVKLDSLLAEGWAGLGYALAVGKYDRLGADSALGRALALDPDYAPAHYWRAQLSVLEGDWAAARRHAMEAVTLDPLSAVAHLVLGLVHRADGRVDDALASFERTTELQPTYYLPYLYLAVEHARRNQSTRSRAAALQFLRGWVGDSVASTLAVELARALAQSGDPTRLAPVLLANGRIGGNELLALVYAAGGVPDSAFARMREAVDQHSGMVVPMLAYLKPLIGSAPQWPALLAQIETGGRRKE